MFAASTAAVQRLMPLEVTAAAAILERSDWLRGTVQLFAWYAESEDPTRIDRLRSALERRERDSPLYRRRLEKAWRAFADEEKRKTKRWR